MAIDQAQRLERLRERLGPDYFAEWVHAMRTWRPAVARKATPAGLYTWLQAEGWIGSEGEFTELFYSAGARPGQNHEFEAL